MILAQIKTVHFLTVLVPLHCEIADVPSKNPLQSKYIVRDCSWKGAQNESRKLNLGSRAIAIRPRDSLSLKEFLSQLPAAVSVL